DLLEFVPIRVEALDDLFNHPFCSLLHAGGNHAADVDHMGVILENSNAVVVETKNLHLECLLTKCINAFLIASFTTGTTIDYLIGHMLVYSPVRIIFPDQ